METLRQQVLDDIRERILRRELGPGQRLIERELAEQLGVSRTPVRESIHELEHEGLVENSPGLGAVVRRISRKELIESLQVRKELDALAARLATEWRSDEDLIYLEAAFRLHEQTVAAQDWERTSDTDSDFHRRIFRAAHNSVLMSVRNAFALYEAFYFHPDLYRYTAEAFGRSVRRHRALVKAIRNRDAETAAKISRVHVQEAMELVRVNSENAKIASKRRQAVPRLARRRNHVRA